MYACACHTVSRIVLYSPVKNKKYTLEMSILCTARTLSNIKYQVLEFHPTGVRVAKFVHYLHDLGNV